MRLTATAVVLAFSVLSLLDAQIDSAALGGLEWRSIGPAATGGRIADMAVVKDARPPDEHLRRHHIGRNF